MIFWGKRRKKRWRELKVAANQFFWQLAMSLAGDTARPATRRRVNSMLLHNVGRSLDHARKTAQRELEANPGSAAAAIQLATIASIRGHWRDAASRWKAILREHMTEIGPDEIERAREAFKQSNDLAAADGLASRSRGAAAMYRVWCQEHDDIDPASVDRARASLQHWHARPSFSLLLVPAEVGSNAFRAAVCSVLTQIYPYWRLTIAIDVSTDSGIAQEIAALTAGDSRVHLLPIPGAQLASALHHWLADADGDYGVILDGKGILAAHALLFMAGEVARDPGIDWIYSDFDHVDELDRRFDPCFLTGPEAELAVAVQRAGMCDAIRLRLVRDFAKEVGGSRQDFAELALFLAQGVAPARIRHMRCILFHVWRHAEDKHQRPAVVETDEVVRLVRAHYMRSGHALEDGAPQTIGGARIRFKIPDPAPLVSIIIPTRDAPHLLQTCIESLRERTDYLRCEIIVVDNQSVEAETLRYLDRLVRQGSIKVLRVEEPFNWSRLNNIAVREAQGSILCFLNNDVEVIDQSWLTEMVSHALRPDVGVVGAALWFPDGRLQHGGIVFQPGTGAASHAMSGARRDERPQRARVTQSIEAVTGACLVVRKEVFLAVGGFDELALPVGYSDVDFCMKVSEKLGLRTLWTPFADLMHLESATRGRLTSREDRMRHNLARRVLLNRWLERLFDDPYYSPTANPGAPLESIYPGARIHLQRCLVPVETRLAFIHIPKTAGVSVRMLFRNIFPPPSVLTLSARTMLQCYDGDHAALSRARARAKPAIVVLGHFSWGFGSLLDLPCRYATVLRHPLARTVSHHNHLLLPQSPFHQERMAQAPLALLLKKGVIPGNLMLRKILGETPESESWEFIDRVCPQGSGFSGFQIPRALWSGSAEELLNVDDVVPDRDVTKVDQAMRIIERDFAFVGRFESLDSQLGSLIQAMGAYRTAPLGHSNGTTAKPSRPLDAEDRDMAESYNYLDQLLYDRIAAIPGGYHLDPDKLAPAGRVDAVLQRASGHAAQ